MQSKQKARCNCSAGKTEQGGGVDTHTDRKTRRRKEKKADSVEMERQSERD
jgi:hypothetical protein